MLAPVSILPKRRPGADCIRIFNRRRGLGKLAQLTRQIFASENKPLFGYIGKGGYNAPSLDGRGSLQKLRGRNKFAAKAHGIRILGRLE